MFKRIILLLLIPAAGFCQLQKGQIYSYQKKLTDSFNLCGTMYYFLDSTGYWMTGCEDHNWRMGKFIYKSDSNFITLDFVAHEMYNPVLSLIKKNIPNKKDISVIITDIYNNTCDIPISIIKIGRKKDRIISTYFNPQHLAPPFSFPKSRKKKEFWTLPGLFPIFLAELHIPFNQKWNYYELQIDMPCDFANITDSKIWVGGKLVLTIIDNKKIKLGEDIYEANK